MTKTTPTKTILRAAVLGLWATGAMAHTPLAATTPANEATIAAAPTQVQLDFKGDIRLTRVTMTYADNAPIDLDLNGVSGFISDYTLPMPPMGSGDYMIEWRGLGTDGHALNGTFGFTVQ